MSEVVNVISQRVRNLLINGAMDFSQRSTSSLSIISSVGNYRTVDRWLIGQLGTTSPVCQRVTKPSPAGGPNNSAHALIMSASFSPGSSVVARQRIEAQYISSDDLKNVSIGFWARSSGPERIRVTLHYADTYNNFSASTLFYDSTTALANNSTWQYCKFENIILPLSAVNGILASIQFESVNQTGSFNCWLTEAMLNEGSLAAPFQRAGINREGELQLCQRYYEKSYDIDVDPGTLTSAGAYQFMKAQSDLARFGPSFLVTKRAPPITAIYTGASLGAFRTEYGDVITPNQGNSNGVGRFTINITSGAGAPWTSRTIGTPCGFQWTADAEL